MNELDFAFYRMKRSTHVSAPLLASVGAALLAGCHQPQMQRCVDERNVVVDPSFCQGQPNPGVQNNNYYHPGYSGFHYYYGGTGGYTPGTVVSGGGFTPRPGVSYSTSSSTSRGGFGSSHAGGGADG